MQSLHDELRLSLDQLMSTLKNVKNQDSIELQIHEDEDQSTSKHQCKRTEVPLEAEAYFTVR